MIYVCSDIHGCYTRFMHLLERIEFSDKDELYILGDVIDRNEHSIKTLLYVMEHQKNIHLLMGNHEEFMYKHLHRVYIEKKLHPNNADAENVFSNDIWLADCNGGTITYNQYRVLNEKQKQDIFKFLSELTVIKLLEVNGKKYHLSHSGTIPRVLEKDTWTLNDLSYQEKDVVLWDSLYRNDGYISLRDYPEGYISIFGHVPVQRIYAKYNSYKIYRNESTIDIDSGCACYEYEKEGVKTALSCYCLDTEKIIYITVKEDE